MRAWFGALFCHLKGFKNPNAITTERENCGRTILTTRDCNESNELVLFSELSKYSATSLVTLPNKLFQ